MNNQERNRDALIAHIQAQDTIIRTRNNEIAELQQHLLAARETPIPISHAVEKKIKAAYKKGWKDAHRVMIAEMRDSWKRLSCYSEPKEDGAND